jgi:hypothetical protein
MRGIFWTSVIAGAGLAVLLLLSEPAPDVGHAGTQSPLGMPATYGGWAIGLAMGVSLAWLARVDWREFPARLADWVRLQRRRVGWVMVGGLLAGILLLF